MDRIPGFSLRAPLEEEKIGMDYAQIGEYAYEFALPLSPSSTLTDVLLRSQLRVRLSLLQRAKRPRADDVDVRRAVRDDLESSDDLASVAAPSVPVNLSKAKFGRQSTDAEKQ